MSERLLNVKSSASSTSIKYLGLERVSEGRNAKKNPFSRASCCVSKQQSFKNCQNLSHYGLLNNHKTAKPLSVSRPTSCFRKRRCKNNCLIHFSYPVCQRWRRWKRVFPSPVPASSPKTRKNMKNCSLPETRLDTQKKRLIYWNMDILLQFPNPFHNSAQKRRNNPFAVLINILLFTRIGSGASSRCYRAGFLPEFTELTILKRD